MITKEIHHNCNLIKDLENFEFNQKEIDDSFILIKKEWERQVANSGKSEIVYANTKEALLFLNNFHDLKICIMEKGFEIPDLISKS